MTNKMKRIICIFLSVIVCLCFMPSVSMSAYATDGEEGQAQEQRNIDLTPYIKSVDISTTIDGKVYGSLDEISAAGIKFKPDDKISVEMAYNTIRDINPQDHLVYKLDKIFGIEDSIQVVVVDKGNDVGLMTIDTNGNVDIDLHDLYIEENGGKINTGRFSFDAALRLNSGMSGTTSVQFGDFTIDIPVDKINQQALVSVKKSVGNYNTATRQLPYTVTVEAPSSNDMTIENVVVKDKFTRGADQILSYQDYKINGAAVSEEKKPDLSSEKELEWKLGNMKPGDKKTLTYTVTLKQLGELNVTTLGNGLKNEAEVWSNGSSMGKTSAEKKLSDGLDIKKSAGNYVYDKDDKCFYINYTISVTAKSTNVSDVMKNINVRDAFTTNKNFVIDANSFSSDNVTKNYTDTDKQFVWNIGSIARGETKTLKYRAKVNKNIMNPEGVRSKIDNSLTNTAKVYQGENYLNRSASATQKFQHEWAKKTGNFIYTGTRAGQVKFTLNFYAGKDSAGNTFSAPVEYFKDTLSGEGFAFIDSLTLKTYSDKDRKNQVGETYTENIAGKTEWKIDLAAKNIPKGAYYYVIEYYAKPIDNTWKYSYGNSYIGKMGDGWEFKTVTNEPEVVRAGKLNAQVSKSAAKGFVNLEGITPSEGSGIIAWESRITSNIIEGATFVDELVVPENSNLDDVFTQALIDNITVKHGNTELDKADYTISFDPELNKKFTITFKKDIQLANSSDYVAIKCYSQVKYRGEASEADADAKAPSTVSSRATNKIKFTNADAVGESTANHDFVAQIGKQGISYNAANREITWRIAVNTTSNDSLLNGDFVIEDILPDTMEYVEGSAKIIAADSKNNASIGDVTVTKNEEAENSKIAIQIKDVPGKASSDMTPQVIIELKAKITDNELGVINDYSRKFTNEAKLKYGDINLETSGSHVVKSNLLEKTVRYGKNTAPYAYYTVKINPEQKDLVIGKDSVMLIDEMGEFLQLVPDTIELTGSVDGKDYTPETYSWNSETRTLKMKVPDGIALTLKYRVLVTKPANEKFNLKNTVYFEAYDNESDTSEGQVVIYKAQAEVSGGVDFVLKKTEVEDGKALQGAEFGVYEVVLNGDYIEKNYLATMTSGSDGIAELPSSVELDTYNVYMYKETKAPTGYQLDETEHYIYFSQDALKNTNNPGLKEALTEAGIYDQLELRVSGMEFNVTNTELPPGEPPETPPTDGPPDEGSDTGDSSNAMASIMLLTLSAIIGLGASVLNGRRREE